MKKPWMIAFCTALALIVTACGPGQKSPPYSSAPPAPPTEKNPPVLAEEATIDPFEEAARMEAPRQPDAELFSGVIPDQASSYLSPTEAALPDEIDVALEERQEVPLALEPEENAEVSLFNENAAVLEALDVDTIELELLRLINEERSANSIEPLGMEESMRWAARIRAPEVLQSLSHTRPDGTPYYTAMDEAGFVYAGKWHGENVSYMYFTPGLYNSSDAAAKMFEELKNSPGHYQNMLSENFLQSGIGAFVQVKDSMIQVGSAQLFAGR